MMRYINDKVTINLSAEHRSDSMVDIAQYAQNSDSLTINLDSDCEFYLCDKGCQSLKNIKFVAGRDTKLIFLTDHIYDNVDIMCLNGSTVYYIQVAHLDMSCYVQPVLVRIQENARAIVRIFPFLCNAAQCTINTLQEHIASHSLSDVYVQGFISEKAQFDHKAMICVPQGIQKAIITQKTVVFMVGNQCRASAIPSFNIASKDVHCGHGAAIGMCDELEQWYLNARGLSEKQAVHVLIKARCLSYCVDDLHKNVYNEIVFMLDRCLPD